nr:unnamed protein product [Callosobruchus analis]
MHFLVIQLYNFSHITIRCSYCNKTFESKRSLDNHIVTRHPVSVKVHECTKCTYKTASASYLKKHITRTHPDIAGCIHCNKTFVFKRTLDDHIVKRHPDFIASVSRKVHECTKCSFKTVSTNYLKRHMVSHQNIAHTRITHKCIYCNKTLSSKQALDDHILNRHPDFIASVSGKVHECTECTYKTVFISQLRGHMAKHPDVAHKYITNRCIYCNKTFASTRSLNDHIVKTHPDFIASVKSKIHECTQCTYKTTISKRIREHLNNHIFIRCIYCNDTFVSKPSLDDHIVKRHPDFIASVSRKIHECTNCTFKTIRASRFKEHIKGHRLTNNCSYCNKTFINKSSLDDHIIKAHPDFIASVSSKIHECTECTYKTVFTSQLKSHMAKHPDIAEHIIKTHPDFIASVSSKVHECTECTYKTTNNCHMKQHMVKHADVADNRITNRCIYCNKTFKGTRSLDNHVIRIHTNFIASVSSKVHECTECTYKTVFTRQLRRHMVNHPDVTGCIHCNKAFTTKKRLDDHIIKKHPDFISSVSSKVHECTECTYKTTDNSNLKQHMLKHPDIAGNHITNRCIHCNKTFTTKKRLDDHIMKKHPDFIASVTSKVHQCTECTYKTTNNSHLRRHMVKHPDIADRCIHCNKAFTTKKRLDDHIIKKHPDFIASVTSKVHQCTECTYKTTDNCHLKQHMAKHPNISGNHIITVCIHCNKTFTTKQKLDEHIVKTHPDFIASVSSGGGY